MHSRDWRKLDISEWIVITSEWMTRKCCLMWNDFSHSLSQSADFPASTAIKAWSANCTQTCLNLYMLTLSVPNFFWLWQKWVYQSVQCHTGLTHPFQFLRFGHSGTHKWAPECPNVKKLTKVGHTTMALNTLKCNHLTSLGLKGLTMETYKIKSSIKLWC